MYLPYEKKLEVDAETGGWNELQFVSQSEFKRMAPPVVQLEVTRLSDLLARIRPGSEEYNMIVRLRFSLERFVEAVSEAECAKASELAAILEEALLLAASCIQVGSEDHAPRLQYVADRIAYIHQRLNFLF